MARLHVPVAAYQRAEVDLRKSTKELTVTEAASIVAAAAAGNAVAVIVGVLTAVPRCRRDSRAHKVRPTTNKRPSCDRNARMGVDIHRVCRREDYELC